MDLVTKKFIIFLDVVFDKVSSYCPAPNVNSDIDNLEPIFS